MAEKEFDPWSLVTAGTDGEGVNAALRDVQATLDEIVGSINTPEIAADLAHSLDVDQRIHLDPRVDLVIETMQELTVGVVDHLRKALTDRAVAVLESSDAIIDTDEEFVEKANELIAILESNYLSRLGRFFGSLDYLSSSYFSIAEVLDELYLEVPREVPAPLDSDLEQIWVEILGAFSFDMASNIANRLSAMGRLSSAEHKRFAMSFADQWFGAVEGRASVFLSALMTNPQLVDSLQQFVNGVSDEQIFLADQQMDDEQVVIVPGDTIVPMREDGRIMIPEGQVERFVIDAAVESIPSLRPLSVAVLTEAVSKRPAESLELSVFRELLGKLGTRSATSAFLEDKFLKGRFLDDLFSRFLNEVLGLDLEVDGQVSEPETINRFVAAREKIALLTVEDNTELPDLGTYAVVVETVSELEQALNSLFQLIDFASEVNRDWYEQKAGPSIEALSAGLLKSQESYLLGFAKLLSRYDAISPEALIEFLAEWDQKRSTFEDERMTFIRDHRMLAYSLAEAWGAHRIDTEIQPETVTAPTLPKKIERRLQRLQSVTLLTDVIDAKLALHLVAQLENNPGLSGSQLRSLTDGLLALDRLHPPKYVLNQGDADEMRRLELLVEDGLLGRSDSPTQAIELPFFSPVRTSEVDYMMRDLIVADRLHHEIREEWLGIPVSEFVEARHTGLLLGLRAYLSQHPSAAALLEQGDNSPFALYNSVLEIMGRGSKEFVPLASAGQNPVNVPLIKDVGRLRRGY